MRNSAPFLAGLHPYDTFDDDSIKAIVARLQHRCYSAGDQIYDFDVELDGLYIIREGEVSIWRSDSSDTELSRLRRGNSFGERGLLRDGRAATRAIAATDAEICLLPAALFHELISTHPPFARFFRRGEARTRPEQRQITTVQVSTIMSPDVQTCSPTATASDAARLMAQAGVSSLCVTDDEKLVGILTVKDLVTRVMAADLDGNTPVGTIMTRDPVALTPSALGSDVLLYMNEHHFAHVPIVDQDRLVGIVTQTDLIKHQALNSAWLIGDIADSADATQIARVTARIPELLVQLVAAGNRHDVVTRLITDIADAATRRLLDLARQQLGEPPCRYLWLACGSQGRREQTGVSDQDNCLIIDDSASDTDMMYFTELARFVTDGLNAAGYVYCPGDMMASNPKWCQRLAVWRDYFNGWISTPDPMAQMLASVMFDLRPIGGDHALYEQLQQETLDRAARNSIFVAHMVSNSLKHKPPLGIFGGLSMNRTGINKHTINMKQAGVVPIVDLARLYALMGQIKPVNTRRRLELAGETTAASVDGARDLLDAYDLIAQHRLEHQARQVAEGDTPDHFLRPASLSGFDRSHLRDAFVVVRTMQSALGSSRAGVL